MTYGARVASEVLRCNNSIRTLCLHLRRPIGATTMTNVPGGLLAPFMFGASSSLFARPPAAWRLGVGVARVFGSGAGRRNVGPQVFMRQIMRARNVRNMQSIFNSIVD